jgi:hypothetical protein
MRSAEAFLAPIHGTVRNLNRTLSLPYPFL